MKFTTEQKFKTLCQITRASHFEWRDTFIKMFPNIDPKDAVMKYWEIVGHDTAKAYLKKVDKNKPIAPQIVEMMVNSSLAMGESATMTEDTNGEVRLVHTSCPWYDWHKKYNAIDEDQPGCDRWINTIVQDFNLELASNIKVKTIRSLPNGNENCTRIFRENI